MTALIGRSLVLLSLLFATTGGVIAFWAGQRASEIGARWARRFAYLYSATIVLANILMVIALLAHDFSVSYVAQVGARSLPAWVTVVSLWSSLEGSILFWGLVLGIYVAVATWRTANRFPDTIPFAIGVWLLTAAFFSFLIAAPAQPFLTVVNPPIDGPGPNPLLQNHILMAIHPPFLYLGYVGMTIPFGLACAALFAGRLGSDFIRLLRSSLLLPWIFLTVAIMLGGWWAYEVLGWGGYWAWDPVENASLLPWLTATAALHSAIVMGRRGILKGWTVTLILATFLLTVLGTFMTRSGVFNSVHSFTQSAIGPTILLFLSVTLIGSVVLLSFRIDRLSAPANIEGLQSREAAFLINNLLFVLLTFTILIGTTFPLIVEAVRDVQMSVGRPYFDRMAVPVGLALLFLMGVGPALPWGKATREQLQRALLPPGTSGLVVVGLALALGVRNGWTLVALFLGGYTAFVTLTQMWKPAGSRMRGQNESAVKAFGEANLKRGRRRFASYIVHAGATIVLVSIAVSSTLSTSTDVQLSRGESAQLGSYRLQLQSVDVVQESHRLSWIARLAVTRNGKAVGEMTPAMNFYRAQKEPIGTPDVRTTLSHDLYLSVLNLDPEQQRVSLHAMINPMVGWIWLATGLMGIGGLVALASPAPRRSDELETEVSNVLVTSPAEPGPTTPIGETS